ncbi:MAG: insulinase family protein [Clostridia bacterium]|nr:insulinase family protein [Clostridia bacterium]
MIKNVIEAGKGMRLRICQTDKFKTGMLSLTLAQPIDRDEVWKSTLLLSVLRRGTEKYPTLAALNRRLDCLYGSELGIRSFYCGDAHVLGFSAEILDDAYLIDREESPLEGVLEVMCQMLFHPLLDENGDLLSHYVESEKQLQCDYIRALKNRPRGYAMQRAKELLYQNEPCGASLYGSEEQIMAITKQELTAHWRSLLGRLAPDFFYVGSADGESVKALLEKTVGKELAQKNGSAVFVQDRNAMIRSAERVTRYEETLPVSQGQLILGLRAGVALWDADFYAMAVYNELLGVSPISKLFVNVREKQSLCYSCSSSYHANKGTVFVSCGIENANRDRAEREILRQLDAIAAGDFSEEEFEGAKKSLLNAYRLIEDSPTAIEGYYLGRSLMGVADTVEEARAHVGKVTREQVLSCAARVSLDTVYYLRGTLAPKEDGEDEME